MEQSYAPRAMASTLGIGGCDRDSEREWGLPQLQMYEPYLARHGAFAVHAA